eukprot:UN13221
MRVILLKWKFIQNKQQKKSKHMVSGNIAVVCVLFCVQHTK